MKFNATEPVRIVIASENPVKANAIESAFSEMFPDTAVQITRISVDSGVSDQPMSDAETKLGAVNRVAAARRAHPDADVWAGLEGGIERDDQQGKQMIGFAWIVIQTQRQQGEARTATFPLPPRVVELILQGVELGLANDEVFGRENSKHHEGAVGTLTNRVIDRKSLYQHAAIMALIPFRNPDLFPPDG